MESPELDHTYAAIFVSSGPVAGALMTTVEPNLGDEVLAAEHSSGKDP